MPSKNKHDQPPLLYADAIDIPVLFRDGPGGRTKGEWRQDDLAAWEGTGFPDKDGWYLPTTTWREILKAAINVGRDLSPWLDRPHYAAREISARIAPMETYMDLHAGPCLHDYNAGRRLTANIVLQEGTESSARGAFSYRMGMTMAEWACRSLMGLSQTWHIEDKWPEGITDAAQKTKPVKGQKNPRPDLWGRHQPESRYWLIEAKGGDIRPGRLDRGWEQLQGGCTVVHPHELDHRLVLCGTGLRRHVSPRNDLFVTIRHEHHPGKPDAPSGSLASAKPSQEGPQSAEASLDEDESGATLLDVARSQMLLFMALRAVEIASVAQLRLVPVARERTERRRASGLLTLMEDDQATRARRDALRERSESPSEEGAQEVGLESFLTARIPGTDVTLGMSQRLYAACETLFWADRDIAARTPGLRAEDHVDVSLREGEIDERAMAARREYRERQEEARPHIERAVRHAFTSSQNGPWRERLAVSPDFAHSPGTLEATTPETYLSINPTDIAHRQH
ncbi:gamma-glutamyltransferase [Streptomyces sp. NRRL S-448]|uniref:gamma-glutamyltransferase n=1 Tax=Streptomyces sp. NRRL S-448 TaxID=1463907 RepID=UPI0035678F39